MGFWWMLCIFPIFLVEPGSPIGIPLLFVLGSIMMTGVIYSAWHLCGIALRRSNAEAQRLEDEEWEQFD